MSYLTDKALMLDEVIEYLKQLQAQVQMMSRMSMPPMMLPMAMQQQRQMSMMAPMGMGMGMGMGLGMGMDMNNINRSNITGISPVLHSTAFMPMTSWDAGSGDRIQATSPTVLCISNKNKTQRAKSCKVLPLHFPLRRMDTNKFADLRADGYIAISFL
ncbi:transcription factor UNE10-like [Quercus lobata]|uniref:transcription factor UNE10-like n=1 Tax=Quercus lobata TaxID=97700 RepID=UPI0012479EF6|nr:transcription factor UNE10-like [Quercus lobata]XP_030963970.1 transcription factor UNE10-like [Quercus lobata]